MRRRGLVSELYRTARIANDVSALASGNPTRIARRAKNVILGRALGRAGVWRALWRLGTRFPVPHVGPGTPKGLRFRDGPSSFTSAPAI